MAITYRSSWGFRLTLEGACTEDAVICLFGVETEEFVLLTAGLAAWRKSFTSFEGMISKRRSGFDWKSRIRRKTRYCSGSVSLWPKGKRMWVSWYTGGSSGRKTNSLQGAAYFLDTKPAPAAWWSMESTMITLSDSKVITGSKPASLKSPSARMRILCRGPWSTKGVSFKSVSRTLSEDDRGWAVGRATKSSSRATGISVTLSEDFPEPIARSTWPFSMASVCLLEYSSVSDREISG